MTASPFDFDKRIHVMFDIETLGIRVTSQMVQLSAVTFTMSPRNIAIQGAFNVFIKNSSESGVHNLVNPFSTDKSTLDWWDKQDILTRETVLRNPAAVNIDQALHYFAQWYKTIGQSGPIWCKGAAFDFAILKHAYSTMMIDQPWHYRHENCLRTLMNIFNARQSELSDLEKVMLGNLKPHDARMDVVVQAKTAIDIYENQNG